jgi:hypothetical protein
VVFDGLPGQDINRRLLFIHDGLLYDLYFAPADPTQADVYGRLETLYAQILGSFTFIPRSSAAGDDCLSPTTGTRLLTNGDRGFCLLYPAGFSAAESPDGAVVLAAGSPAQANGSKVHIEVKDASGSTAEQLANGLVAEAEKGTPAPSVERTFGLTIGYEPAELLDGMPGPDISRHVLAVHAGKLYRLIFTPADPSQREAYAQMQALYELVTRSFRFLPPVK